MTLYVVGFMLDGTREDVVLVRKNRPPWQAGLLNGVGGKLESGERFEEAAAREFEEEAGAWTSPSDWERIAGIIWQQDGRADGMLARVEFLRCACPGPLPKVEGRTDEPIEVHPVRAVAAGALPVVPNLRWLVPLAAYTADRYEPFVVRATVAEVLG